MCTQYINGGDTKSGRLYICTLLDIYIKARVHLFMNINEFFLQIIGCIKNTSIIEMIFTLLYTKDGIYIT